MILDCNVCLEDLPISRFSPRADVPRGYQYTCSKCVKQALKSRLSTVKGRLRHTLTTSKASAKTRGLSWNLTLQDLEDLYAKQDGKCALSGVVLTLAVQSRDSEFARTTLSLDRKDNSIGYQPDNIQLVTSYANTAKNKYSLEELVEFCKNVIATQERI